MGRTADEHFADPLAAAFAMGLFHHQDSTFRQVGQSAGAALLVLQSGRAMLLELLFPRVQRVT